MSATIPAQASQNKSKDTDRREAANLTMSVTDWDWYSVHNYLRKRSAEVTKLLWQPDTWTEVMAMAGRVLVGEVIVG